MDFLKSNLFYIILVAAVLVVSIPSFILASRRQEQVRKALASANQSLNGVKIQVNRLSPVSDAALTAAENYKNQWQVQRAEIVEQIRASDRHLDEDFLVPPSTPGQTPDPQQYVAAYKAAMLDLGRRLAAAGLAVDKAKQPAISPPYPFADVAPPADEVRITQKEYWILKELVDILTDPQCGVKSVQSIVLDYWPGAPDTFNRPDTSKAFWQYPMALEFQMDFRCFPVFLEKVVSNKNILFFPFGYEVTRSFDDTTPVYTPLVSVTFYCQAWDYVSTPFEKDLLAKFGGGAPKGGAAPKGGGAGRGSGRAGAK